MRPIAGVVVDSTRRELVIELENGALVSAKQRKGFKLGTKCWISYDFTIGEVRQIYKDDPQRELKQDTTEEVTKAEHGVIEDAPEESDEDSGDLSPCSDVSGWEFWSSDSGVLLTE